MRRYRVTLTIEDEIEAATHEEAWVKFSERVKRGYYGPTKEDVEFIEEVEVAEYSKTEE